MDDDIAVDPISPNADTTVGLEVVPATIKEELGSAAMYATARPGFIARVIRVYLHISRSVPS